LDSSECDSLNYFKEWLTNDGANDERSYQPTMEKAPPAMVQLTRQLCVTLGS
jgi:hypothetical protein